MNVIWAITVEDDVEQSVFFNEFRNIVLHAPKKNILFLMYYRSLSWKKAIFLKYVNDKWTYDAVPMKWTHSRILTKFFQETQKYRYESLNLYMSGHCWKHTLYTQGSEKGLYHTYQLADWAKKHHIYWNLIIFDCCYMATIENIKYLSPVASYLIALETSQGYVGFQMPDLMSLFTEKNTLRLAKLIARKFIKQEANIEELGWASDVSIIDLQKGKKLVEWVQEHHNQLKRNDKTRVEICETKKCKKEYDLFDLWLASPKTEEFIKLFHQTLLFYGQNRLMKENKKLSKRLHGIATS